MLLIENKKGRRGIDGQIAFFKCPSIEFKRHLHPHLSVLNIVLDGIQNLLCIGDSQNLEIHIPEVDRVEDVVLPGDDDCAFVDWGAYFEADVIVRKKDELGCIPDAEHLWVIEEQGGNF